MDDYISRAAIIRAVEENPFVTDSVKSFVRCSARNIPAADVRPAAHWILCSEKLPDERQQVYIRLQNGNVFRGEIRTREGLKEWWYNYDETDDMDTLGIIYDIDAGGIFDPVVEWMPTDIALQEAEKARADRLAEKLKSVVVENTLLKDALHKMGTAAQETGTPIDRRGIGKRENDEITEQKPEAAIKPNSDHEAVHNTITLNPEEAEQLAKFLADALPAYIHRLAKTDLPGINTLTGIYRRCLNA